MKYQPLIVILAVLISCGPDPQPVPESIVGAIFEDHLPIPDVSIRLNGEIVTQTGLQGSFTISGLEPGVYIVKPEQSGRTFHPEADTVTVTASADPVGVAFARVGIGSFVHRGRIWTPFNQAVFTVATDTEARLRLTLAQNALWFNNSAAGLLYTTVTGDFTFEARVSAVRRTDNTQTVACNICLGGLMVRNMASTSQNYVHLVTGQTPGGLGVETKSTTNSNSTYVPTAANQLPHTDGSAVHDLRIQRVGSTFNLFKKAPGELNWVACGTYQRPDLP